MIIFKSFTFIILVSSLSGQKEIDFNNLEKIECLNKGREMSSKIIQQIGARL